MITNLDYENCKDNTKIKISLTYLRVFDTVVNHNFPFGSPN